jgi:hypothetical protein
MIEIPRNRVECAIALPAVHPYDGVPPPFGRGWSPLENPLHLMVGAIRFYAVGYRLMVASSPVMTSLPGTVSMPRGAHAWPRFIVVGVACSAGVLLAGIAMNVALHRLADAHVPAAEMLRAYLEGSTANASLVHTPAVRLPAPPASVVSADVTVSPASVASADVTVSPASVASADVTVSPASVTSADVTVPPASVSSADVTMPPTSASSADVTVPPSGTVIASPAEGPVLVPRAKPDHPHVKQHAMPHAALHGRSVGLAHETRAGRSVVGHSVPTIGYREALRMARQEMIESESAAPVVSAVSAKGSSPGDTSWMQYTQQRRITEVPDQFSTR